MEAILSREEAEKLLKTYNQDEFHLKHAHTVEAVMRWYAVALGYADEAEFWATVGLLHDIDFERWPEQHCIKAPELLRAGGVGEEMIHAICSHGWGPLRKPSRLSQGNPRFPGHRRIYSRKSPDSIRPFCLLRHF